MSKSVNKVIEFQNLSFSYGENPAIRDISLSVERGEFVAIVGPNGSGKSTLLRALAGRIEPSEGEIGWSERARIGYYDQHQDEELDGRRTVFDEVSSVAEGQADVELRKILGRFLFTGDDIHKRVAVLSGGERSRVALAKFLISPSNVLLLDEPTNHLDVTTRRKLIQALIDFNGTILCASHDVAILDRVATKAYEIIDGECNRLMDWKAWAPTP